MKKGILFIAAMLAISSCGLFFVDGTQGALLTPLATVSGDSISTDEYNEKHPFLLRLQNGDAYLLFSSDRNGSYDIFLAKMGDNGVFENPEPLSPEINSNSSDELNPVAFDNYGEVELTFIRITGSITNIVLYSLNSADFIPVNYLQTFPENASGIGLLKSGANFYLLSSYGGKEIKQFNYIGIWDNGFPTVITQLNNVSSINAIGLQISNGMDFFIESALVNGKYKILAEGIFYGAMSTRFDISTSLYQSEDNNISPYIDIESGYKVYFASDRYGKGNYDLYRYNILTYNHLPEVESVFSEYSERPAFPAGYPMNSDWVYVSNLNIAVPDPTNTYPDNIVRVYFSLDNGPFTGMSYNGDGTWEYTIDYIAEGVHTLRTYGKDVLLHHSLTNSVTFTSAYVLP
ncbi:MAG: hypothetical protein A2Y33_11275 [Spirochaetes bacterium GWF1_51_8]|nr:MAG: hypothetical protein A2Y33_11275 [Spirochaetes bacterium GWF1_51_8]